MSDWATVAVAGVTAASALGGAWGSVAINARLERRRSERTARARAVTQLVSAVDSLTLRVLNNRIARHPTMIAREALVSSAKTVLVVLSLGAPPVRRRLGTPEVALLASTLDLPRMPAVDVPPAQLVAAYDAVQQATAGVQIVGSPHVIDMADRLLAATRELVAYAEKWDGTRWWQWQPSTTLRRLIEQTNSARQNLVAAARGETLPADTRRLRRRHHASHALDLRRHGHEGLM